MARDAPEQTVASMSGSRGADVRDNKPSVSGEPTELDDALAALVGKSIGDGGPQRAPDPVNQPMIRHWAAAFDDANPVYVDAAAAASSRHGEIVAPPLMLQTWTMATPTITGIRERGGSPVEADDAEVLRLLDDDGMVGTLATNSEFEIARYLHLGDVVTAETVLESVSPEKQTRLGRGRFVTWVTTYVDGAGELVGRQTFRILKFDPNGLVARAGCPLGLRRACRRIPSSSGPDFATADSWCSVATGVAPCDTRPGRCVPRVSRSRGRRSNRRAAASC